MIKSTYILTSAYYTRIDTDPEFSSHKRYNDMTVKKYDVFVLITKVRNVFYGLHTPTHPR